MARLKATQKGEVFMSKYFQLPKHAYTIFAVMLFLVVTVCQGVSFIVNIGALTIPDSNMHALGAYTLATGQIFNQTEEYIDSFGNENKAQVLNGDEDYLLQGGGRETA